MKTLLVGVGSATVDAVVRVLAGQGEAPVVADDVHEALRRLGPATASIAMIESESSVTLADTCRAIRASPQSSPAVIVGVVHGAGGNLDALMDAGVDDVYFTSLGETVLRMRLSIAARNAERAVAARSLEEDLARLFHATVDMVAVAGLDGYFKRLSPSWTITLGWTPQELTDRPWLDFVHPDDVDATIGAGRDLASGVTVIAFSNRYRCRDGTYRWLDWVAVPAVDRGSIYATARDVTDQRQAQEALREVTESLTTTLNSIGDAVISTDASGMVIRMNPVAEALTGWSIAEARSQPIADVLRLLDETTRVPAGSPVERAIREGIVVGFADHTLLVRRDGFEVPIADSCAPILDASSRVSGAVLVFRDVSAARTARLLQSQTEKQLVFAERMASVGTLAAGVAHEINNPLSFVTTNIDMIIEEINEIGGGSVSGRLKALLEMAIDAREGSERVRKIVRGLKTFARSDDEERVSLDLRPVIELSINMAFHEIRHRARLVKDFGPTPLVSGDDARLGQVFVNLLVNAAQAIPDGHAENNEIRIATSTDVAGNAVVEVRDSGSGIPVGLIQRVFEPFFTTKPVGVGTGLGLAICHSIVTGLGGAITVANNPSGGGTTFRVVLPAARASASAALGDATAPKVGVARRATVLVVDDEPSMRIAISRVLRDHDVTLSSSGHQALATLASGKTFDVILSDLMMPEMSGVELYGELVRRFPEHAERVVFVTGGAFTGAATEFLERVSNERLEKPFEPRTLRALVERFAR